MPLYLTTKHLYMILAKTTKPDKSKIRAGKNLNFNPKMISICQFQHSSMYWARKKILAAQNCIFKTPIVQNLLFQKTSDTWFRRFDYIRIADETLATRWSSTWAIFGSLVVMMVKKRILNQNKASDAPNFRNLKTCKSVFPITLKLMVIKNKKEIRLDEV